MPLRLVRSGHRHERWIPQDQLSEVKEWKAYQKRQKKREASDTAVIQPNMTERALAA